MIEALFMVPATDIPEYKVPAVYREYERCVATRESNSRPEAVSPSGSIVTGKQIGRAHV